MEELLDTRGVVFRHDLRLLPHHLPGARSSNISGKWPLFTIVRLLIELLPQRVEAALCVGVPPASLNHFPPGHRQVAEGILIESHSLSWFVVGVFIFHKVILYSPLVSVFFLRS